MKKITNYKIGDLIAIPLDKGYSVGLIANASSYGMLCYFFSPRFERLPTVSMVNVSKENVVLVKLCSDLGIHKNKWIVIGELPNFNQTDWNTRFFKRQDVLSNEFYVIEYNNELKEINSWLSEDESSIIEYPEDGLAGSGFIEKRLSKILAS